MNLREGQPIAGPLVGLSVRRTPRGVLSVPKPPSNAERLAAYRQAMPPAMANAYRWPHLQPQSVTPNAGNVVRINRRGKTCVI